MSQSVVENAIFSSVQAKRAVSESETLLAEQYCLKLPSAKIAGFHAFLPRFIQKGVNLPFELALLRL